MGTKLYIGNLPYSTTSDSLKEMFSEAGTVVSAQVMTDKISGRSRGFGFVEMSTPEETQAAIEKLNGYETDGRKIVVNEARPLGDRPPRRSFGGGGGGRGGYGGGGGGGYGGGGRGRDY